MRYDDKGVYYDSKGKISPIPKSIPPIPDKFKDRLDSKDGSFTTKDGKLYYYNEKGGWSLFFFVYYLIFQERYDENFNYFNKYGELDNSSSDLESSLEEVKKKKSGIGASEQEADDENGRN